MSNSPMLPGQQGDRFQGLSLPTAAPPSESSSHRTPARHISPHTSDQHERELAALLAAAGGKSDTGHGGRALRRKSLRQRTLERHLNQHHGEGSSPTSISFSDPAAHTSSSSDGSVQASPPSSPTLPLVSQVRSTTAHGFGLGISGPPSPTQRTAKRVISRAGERNYVCRDASTPTLTASSGFSNDHGRPSVRNSFSKRISRLLLDHTLTGVPWRLDTIGQIRQRKAANSDERAHGASTESGIQGAVRRLARRAQTLVSSVPTMASQGNPSQEAQIWRVDTYCGRDSFVQQNGDGHDRLAPQLSRASSSVSRLGVPAQYTGTQTTMQSTFSSHRSSSNSRDSSAMLDTFEQSSLEFLSELISILRSTEISLNSTNSNPQGLLTAASPLRPVLLQPARRRLLATLTTMVKTCPYNTQIRETVVDATIHLVDIARIDRPGLCDLLGYVCRLVRIYLELDPEGDTNPWARLEPVAKKLTSLAPVLLDLSAADDAALAGYMFGSLANICVDVLVIQERKTHGSNMVSPYAPGYSIDSLLEFGQSPRLRNMYTAFAERMDLFAGVDSASETPCYESWTQDSSFVVRRILELASDCGSEVRCWFLLSAILPKYWHRVSPSSLSSVQSLFLDHANNTARRLLQADVLRLHRLPFTHCFSQLIGQHAIQHNALLSKPCIRFLINCTSISLALAADHATRVNHGSMAIAHFIDVLRDKSARPIVITVLKEMLGSGTLRKVLHLYSAISMSLVPFLSPPSSHDAVVEIISASMWTFFKKVHQECSSPVANPPSSKDMAVLTSLLRGLAANYKTCFYKPLIDLLWENDHQHIIHRVNVLEFIGRLSLDAVYPHAGINSLPASRYRNRSSRSTSVSTHMNNASSRLDVTEDRCESWSSNGTNLPAARSAWGDEPSRSPMFSGWWFWMQDVQLATLLVSGSSVRGNPVQRLSLGRLAVISSYIAAAMTIRYALSAGALVDEVSIVSTLHLLSEQVSLATWARGNAPSSIELSPLHKSLLYTLLFVIEWFDEDPYHPPTWLPMLCEDLDRIGDRIDAFEESSRLDVENARMLASTGIESNKPRRRAANKSYGAAHTCTESFGPILTRMASDASSLFSNSAYTQHPWRILCEVLEEPPLLSICLRMAAFRSEWLESPHLQSAIIPAAWYYCAYSTKWPAIASAGYLINVGDKVCRGWLKSFALSQLTDPSTSAAAGRVLKHLFYMSRTLAQLLEFVPPPTMLSPATFPTPNLPPDVGLVYPPTSLEPTWVTKLRKVQEAFGITDAENSESIRSLGLDSHAFEGGIADLQRKTTVSFLRISPWDILGMDRHDDSSSWSPDQPGHPQKNKAYYFPTALDECIAHATSHGRDVHHADADDVSTRQLARFLGRDYSLPFIRHLLKAFARPWRREAVMQEVRHLTGLARTYSYMPHEIAYHLTRSILANLVSCMSKENADSPRMLQMITTVLTVQMPILVELMPHMGNFSVRDLNTINLGSLMLPSGKFQLDRRARSSPEVAFSKVNTEDLKALYRSAGIDNQGGLPLAHILDCDPQLHVMFGFRTTQLQFARRLIIRMPDEVHAVKDLLRTFQPAPLLAHIDGRLYVKFRRTQPNGIVHPEYRAECGAGRLQVKLDSFLVCGSEHLFGHSTELVSIGTGPIPAVEFLPVTEHQQDCLDRFISPDIASLSGFYARSWLLLLRHMAARLPSTLINPVEHRRFLLSISVILIQQHRRQPTLISLCFFLLAKWATHFQLYFRTFDGYSIILPALMRVYCETESLKTQLTGSLDGRSSSEQRNQKIAHLLRVQQSIEYLLGLFLQTHDEVFLYQLVSSIAPIVHLSMGGCETGAAGHKAVDQDNIVLRCFYLLIRSLERPPKYDTLGVSSTLSSSVVHSQLAGASLAYGKGTFLPYKTGADSRNHRNRTNQGLRLSSTPPLTFKGAARLPDASKSQATQGMPAPPVITPKVTLRLDTERGTSLGMLHGSLMMPDFVRLLLTSITANPGGESALSFIRLLRLFLPFIVGSSVLEDAFLLDALIGLGEALESFRVDPHQWIQKFQLPNMPDKSSAAGAAALPEQRSGTGSPRTSQSGKGFVTPPNSPDAPQPTRMPHKASRGKSKAASSADAFAVKRITKDGGHVPDAASIKEEYVYLVSEYVSLGGDVNDALMVLTGEIVASELQRRCTNGGTRSTKPLSSVALSVFSQKLDPRDVQLYIGSLVCPAIVATVGNSNHIELANWLRTACHLILLPALNLLAPNTLSSYVFRGSIVVNNIVRLFIYKPNTYAQHKEFQRYTVAFVQYLATVMAVEASANAIEISHVHRKPAEPETGNQHTVERGASGESEQEALYRESDIVKDQDSEADSLVQVERATLTRRCAEYLLCPLSISLYERERQTPDLVPAIRRHQYWPRILAMIEDSELTEQHFSSHLAAPSSAHHVIHDQNLGEPENSTHEPPTDQDSRPGSRAVPLWNSAARPGQNSVSSVRDSGNLEHRSLPGEAAVWLGNMLIAIKAALLSADYHTRKLAAEDVATGKRSSNAGWHRDQRALSRHLSCFMDKLLDAAIGVNSTLTSTSRRGSASRISISCLAEIFGASAMTASDGISRPLHVFDYCLWTFLEFIAVFRPLGMDDRIQTTIRGHVERIRPFLEHLERHRQRDLVANDPLDMSALLPVARSVSRPPETSFSMHRDLASEDTAQLDHSGGDNCELLQMRVSLSDGPQTLASGQAKLASSIFSSRKSLTHAVSSSCSYNMRGSSKLSSKPKPITPDALYFPESLRVPHRDLQAVIHKTPQDAAYRGNTPMSGRPARKLPLGRAHQAFDGHPQGDFNTSQRTLLLAHTSDTSLDLLVPSSQNRPRRRSMFTGGAAKAQKTYKKALLHARTLGSKIPSSSRSWQKYGQSVPGVDIAAIENENMDDKKSQDYDFQELPAMEGGGGQSQGGSIRHVGDALEVETFASGMDTALYKDMIRAMKQVVCVSDCKERGGPCVVGMHGSTHILNTGERSAQVQAKLEAFFITHWWLERSMLMKAFPST
ncbi:hypothetical protein GQ54DRAFT_222444 [Martensiomyces pterosporus]|nr:hypothetical protein GQ54DRAFT_222444 [Martensiomyces pterosporus]